MLSSCSEWPTLSMILFSLFFSHQEVASLLLTSNVHINSKQLQALSSSSTSSSSSSQQQQATISTSSPPYPSSSHPSSQVRSNQPTDGGFLLANTTFGLGGEKSDLDSSETNLTGVGARGAIMIETPSEEPSLYAYLFDMFGESLGLRLSGHDALKRKKDASVVPTQQAGEANAQQQQAPSNKDIRHVNKAVVQFLSREGFKSVKVELPYSRPPPQQQGRGGWRSQTSFHIPHSILPVQWNVLEQGMRMGHGQQQYRGRVKTGVSVSYKRRLHKLKHSSDIGSSWLWLTWLYIQFGIIVSQCHYYTASQKLIVCIQTVLIIIIISLLWILS